MVLYYSIYYTILYYIIIIYIISYHIISYYIISYYIILYYITLILSYCIVYTCQFSPRVWGWSLPVYLRICRLVDNFDTMPKLTSSSPELFPTLSHHQRAKELGSAWRQRRDHSMSGSHAGCLKDPKSEYRVRNTWLIYSRSHRC